MFELKRLSRQGVSHAIERAERYRLLNEPRLAESICLDVLEADPDNQRALITLLLARTDQFVRDTGARVEDARGLLPKLGSEYDRLYYAGIICERWAKAQLTRDQPGSGPIAYEWLRQAMEWYEKAEQVRPAGDDDPILRWNTCARMIMRHPHVGPDHEDDFSPLLE